MSSKTVNIVLVFFLLTSAEFCLASANKKTDSLRNDSAIRVHLPREVIVKDNCFRLGQVGIIRGEESLVVRAKEIALGRLSVPGQKIVVDRSVVLSRLACSGIPSSKVTFTGAEKITVKREHQIIKGRQFVELAGSFLKKNPSVRSACQLDPVWLPKDLAIPDASKDIKFCARLVRSSATNRAKVQIDVLADGKQIGTRDVAFLLKYNRRRLVALVDIPVGTAISAENVKIEKTLSNCPEPAGWSPPYGLIAKRQIAANTVVHSHMIGPVKPPLIIKRNQTVVIRIERPGLFVTAVGKAIQQGRAGEYIKVQNKDSRRIILARVNEDGTVKPVL
jgi:flagella basal body P-ring formation protein FlgA